MTWLLRINEVPPSGNVIMRMHWAVYKKLMTRWWWLVREAEGFTSIPKATRKRRVTITRYARGKSDKFNRGFSMKVVEDVLKPQKTVSGIYKSGKKKGLPYTKTWIGHGLIIEDDDDSVEIHVKKGALLPKEKPYITILIEELT